MVVRERLVKERAVSIIEGNLKPTKDDDDDDDDRVASFSISNLPARAARPAHDRFCTRLQRASGGVEQIQKQPG